MNEDKVKLSYDDTEQDYVLSWETEDGVYLVTIPSNVFDNDVMVSYADKSFHKSWRQFIELEKNKL